MPNLFTAARKLALSIFLFKKKILKTFKILSIKMHVTLTFNSDTAHLISNYVIKICHLYN